jgi:hypothetical protein
MAGLVSRGRRPSSYPKTTSLISCCAQPETEVEARADTTHRRAGRSPIVVSRQSHYGRPAVLSDSDAHPRRSRCVRSPFSASSSLVLVPARPPVLLSHASSRRTQISPYRPTRPRGGRIRPEVVVQALGSRRGVAERLGVTVSTSAAQGGFDFTARRPGRVAVGHCIGACYIWAGTPSRDLRTVYVGF